MELYCNIVVYLGLSLVLYSHPSDVLGEIFI